MVQPCLRIRRQLSNILPAFPSVYEVMIGLAKVGKGAGGAASRPLTMRAVSVYGCTTADFLTYC
jgi:hypothetical protein